MKKKNGSEAVTMRWGRVAFCNLRMIHYVSYVQGGRVVNHGRLFIYEYYLFGSGTLCIIMYALWETSHQPPVGGDYASVEKVNSSFVRSIIHNGRLCM